MKDFKVVKTLDRGAFGTVYLVRHKKTQRVLAMKELNIRMKNDKEHAQMEHSIISVLDHPFVLPLLCSFETKDNLYMVMEYTGGGDCYSLFISSSVWTMKKKEDISRFYIAELVLAVEYIHSMGIIHRDLKPNNMMISKTGHLRLIDFGISKACSVKTGTRLTEADCQKVAREFTDREQCCTLEFVSPEVWKEEDYGEPIDWWSIGVILFFSLTLKYPFNFEGCFLRKESDESVDTDSWGRSTGVFPNIEWPKDGPPLSEEALSLVLGLLEKDPVKRLGTRGASEVKQHPFFKGVDWTNLPNQTPPFIPELKHEEDTKYFSSTKKPPSHLDDDKCEDRDNEEPENREDDENEDMDDDENEDREDDKIEVRDEDQCEDRDDEEPENREDDGNEDMDDDENEDMDDDENEDMDDDENEDMDDDENEDMDDDENEDMDDDENEDMDDDENEDMDDDESEDRDDDECEESDEDKVCGSPMHPQMLLRPLRFTTEKTKRKKLNIKTVVKRLFKGLKKILKASCCFWGN